MVTSIGSKTDTCLHLNLRNFCFQIQTIGKGKLHPHVLLAFAPNQQPVIGRHIKVMLQHKFGRHGELIHFFKISYRAPWMLLE